MELSQKICNDKTLSGIFKNAIEARKLEEDFKNYREMAEKEKLKLIEDIEKFKKDAKDARNNSISFKFKLETSVDEINKKEYFIRFIISELIKKLKEEKEKLKEEASSISKKFGLFENLINLQKIHDDFEKEEESSDIYEKTIINLLNKQNGEKNVAMYLFVEHQKIEKLKERISVLEKEKKETQYQPIFQQQINDNYLKNIFPDNKSQNVTNLNQKRRLELPITSLHASYPDDEISFKKMKINTKDEEERKVEEKQKTFDKVKVINSNPFENTKIIKETLSYPPVLTITMSSTTNNLNNTNQINKQVMNPCMMVKKSNSILNNMKQSTLISSNSSNSSNNLLIKK